MTPEMLLTLSKAWRHILGHTLVSLGTPGAWVVLRTPAVVAVMARVERLALTGDVLATQLACQHWAQACRKAML